MALLNDRDPTQTWISGQLILLLLKSQKACYNVGLYIIWARKPGSFGPVGGNCNLV